jgi:antitoxin HigA-1
MAKNLTFGLRTIHPGEMLREDVLPALGRSKTEIARLLGISRQTLYDILNEKQPITAQMALRIGKLCGNGGDIWSGCKRGTICRWPRQRWVTRSMPFRCCGRLEVDKLCSVLGDTVTCALIHRRRARSSSSRSITIFSPATRMIPVASE